MIGTGIWSLKTRLTFFWKKQQMYIKFGKVCINPLMANIKFLYYLKTLEKRRFSDVFRGYKDVILDINGLKLEVFLWLIIN